MITKDTYQTFIEELKSYKEDKYRDFSLKLIKTNYIILGVRTKYLDKLAKKINYKDIDNYYKLVNFKYYEEVMILGFVIAKIKDNNTRIKYFTKFISKVDNWAICDMVINRFKLKEEELPSYLPYLKKYINSNHEFTIRAAYVFLLNYYIDEKYLDTIFDLVSKNKNNSYYVMMAIAWLLSYCYFLNKKKLLNFLENTNLNIFIYNKTIMKIRESLRISKEEKDRLKLLLKKCN